MPALRIPVRGGAQRRGGIAGYPLEVLHGEVAFVAYHFHWPLADIRELQHAERRRWVEEISSINRRITEGHGS